MWWNEIIIVLGTIVIGLIPVISITNMQILGSVISVVLILSMIIITLVYVISPKAPTGEKLSSY
jgi:hypothetical protein